MYLEDPGSTAELELDARMPAQDYTEAKMWHAATALLIV